VDAPERKPLGRNDPCHCGSGKKHKQCCLDKDEAAARDARAQAQAGVEAATPDDDAAEIESPLHARHHGHPVDGRQPSRRGGANTRALQRASNTRKSGGS